MIDIHLLWNGIQTPNFRRVLREIQGYGADLYWIVGDKEAVLLAEQLAEKAPVHLTMHDDLAQGQFGTGLRYRWLRNVADRRLSRTMTLARSVDVVSRGMQDYYRRRFGIQSTVVHRYLPALPMISPPANSSSALIIGHLGPLYSMHEIRQFCLALRAYGAEQKLKPQFLAIAGLGERNATLYAEFPDILTEIPALSEAEAVERLSTCSFVYAMYPFEKHWSIFRQTSSPTKVTTYLQVQRPIFAHTPTDSTLAEMVKQYQLGTVSSSLAVADLMADITQVVREQPPRARFEAARAALHGRENVSRLNRCLVGC